MTKGKKRIKTLLRFISGSITVLLVAIGVAVMLLGGVIVWDTYDVEVSAAKERFAVYKPEEEKAGFDELRSINSDVIGWINVYGTNIDYPIVQAKDNWEYLTKDVFGDYSLTGSIFLDSDNSADFSDFNSILYGHNMTPAVMFGAVKDFKDKTFFDGHAYGDLYYGGTHYGLVFTRLVEADAYDNFIFAPGIEGKENRLSYLSRLASLTVHSRDEIKVRPKDRIVLLSTCSNVETNIRDILVAKITDETYADPFAEGQKGKVDQRSVDQQKHYPVFRFIRDYWWLILIIVTAGIAASVLIRRRRKKATKKDV